VDRTWGWDESWQQEYFFSHFNEQQLHIIHIDNTDIGVLSAEENEETVLLRIIEILPRYKNRGIGTSIIKDIIKNALLKGKSLRLQVLKVNERARVLYERLGFCITGETDTHYLMEYSDIPD
jgi:GNAT superfamily N-acetyltransferase